MCVFKDQRVPESRKAPQGNIAKEQVWNNDIPGAFCRTQT